MEDYHPEAVLVSPTHSLCGAASIRAHFADIFKAGASNNVNMRVYKKETVCDSGFACVSYVSYSTSLYQLAMDTIVYSAHGQIVSHTWAGKLTSSAESVGLVADTAA